MFLDLAYDTAIVLNIIGIINIPWIILLSPFILGAIALIFVLVYRELNDLFLEWLTRWYYGD
jgi:hypothetical protein